MRKLALALALGVLVALPAAAMDPLSLVPSDATAVGMLRVSDIRTSPYAARLFNETDRCTVDGDAARFLAEARLRPTEDVDTIVFAATAGTGGAHGSGLVVLEGRFEAANVEAALLSRGATKKSVTGGTLVILPEKTEHHDGTPGALAFLDRHLAVAGTQPAVEGALARVAAFSRRDFRTGAGLGRHMGRIPHDATAWILVDVARQPMGRAGEHAHAAAHGDSADSGSRQVMQVASVMKQVPLLAMSTTLKNEAMTVSAFGLCEDADTRGLLEDSLRGLLAAWRLAVQDEKPDLVPILRTFKVEQTKDGVSLTGKLPGSALAAIFDKDRK